MISLSLFLQGEFLKYEQINICKEILELVVLKKKIMYKNLELRTLLEKLQQKITSKIWQIYFDMDYEHMALENGVRSDAMVIDCIDALAVRIEGTYVK